MQPPFNLSHPSAINTDMIPEVYIISGKASMVSTNRAGGSARAPQREFQGVLGSKEHLDWLKIDLNAAKIITVQDFKLTKN